MKNLSVKLKMTIIGVMIVAFMLFSIQFSVNSMQAIDERILLEEEENIRTDYDNSIRQQVEQVITLLETYQAEIEAGVYTREEGMALAADKVRALRYGTDGYFWVDQSDGTNVVLLGNDTEGTNRMGTTDVNGFAMVKDFIQGAVAEGSYFSDYAYQRRAEPSRCQNGHTRSTLSHLTGLSARETTSTILMHSLQHLPRPHTPTPTRKSGSSSQSASYLPF